MARAKVEQITIEDSKSSQTDEEKQRERQRNEREQKNAEQEAINYKRDRDAREARLLDFEIRRAHEKDRKKEIEKQQILKQQQHQQQSLSEKSTPSSAGNETKSPRDPSDRAFPRSRTKSIEEDGKAPATSPDREIDLEASEIKDHASTTPSPQTITGPQASHSVVAGPPATAAAATAAIIPILPLGVAALRDDSTESDQSLTFSQSDAYHRIFTG